MNLIYNLISYSVFPFQLCRFMSIMTDNLQQYIGNGRNQATLMKNTSLCNAFIRCPILHRLPVILNLKSWKGWQCHYLFSITHYLHFNRIVLRVALRFFRSADILLQITFFNKFNCNLHANPVKGNKYSSGKI